MNRSYLRASLVVALTALATPAWAGVQVGPSGKTFASDAITCALHPTRGLAPVVQAGLYLPKKNASATVWQGATLLGTVTTLAPAIDVWLDNGVDTVAVDYRKNAGDSFTFDASLTFAGQANMCIPDTSANTISGDLEYGAAGASYAVVPVGCAWGAGGPQPYVNLFDNGTYLLNVSVNGAPLTQLGLSRPHVPVFLAAGLNVIRVDRGALSTEYYVRDGGTGTCTLP